ncbi:MAG: hypothetical protein ACRC5H_05885 [Treponemataceae bacterium]
MDTSRSLKINFLSVAFFLIIFALLVGTLIKREPTQTDSDIASELVLSKQLASENKILSTEWYYSTEIRVINTQIISTILFKLTDNWKSVRFFTSLICCVLLVLSFLFLLWQLDLKNFSQNLFASSFFLLPISGSIFVMVLQENYYLTHIVFVFILLGLYLFLCKQKKSFTIALIFFIIVAFFAGFAGPRYLLILIFPLFVASFLSAFSKLIDFSSFSLILKTVQSSKEIKIATMGFISGVSGYLGNSIYLAKKYNFQNWNEKLFTEGSDFFAIFLRLIANFFGFVDGRFSFSIKVFFGYMFFISLVGLLFVFTHLINSKKLSLLSKVSVHSFLSLPFIAVSLLLSVAGRIGIQDLILSILEILGFSTKLTFYTIFVNVFVLFSLSLLIFLNIKFYNRANQNEKNFVFFVISSFVINSFVFLITQKPVVNRFYLPIVFLLFPLAALAISSLSENLKKYKKLFILIFLTPLVLSSLPYYKSELLQKPDLQRVTLLNFLLDNNFSFGYAAFWEANALTEYSNGAIEMVGLKMGSNRDITEASPFEHHAWLTLKRYYQPTYKKDEKVFLLLSNNDYMKYKALPFIQQGKIDFTNERFTVISYPTNHDFKNAVRDYLQKIEGNTDFW